METEKHSSVTLSALPQGGYVVLSADPLQENSYRPLLAAFTTLPEALVWVAHNMQDVQDPGSSGEKS